jgi:phospholipid/cholesterol/gamma-HCH transport system substrate-binding protein
MEWDETMKELNQMVTALGPNGANKNGAVSKLLGTASEYKGEGQLFHDTLQEVSAATQTLSGGSQNLFGNIRNLQLFTSALSDSDQQITQFIDRFNTVSGTLNDDRRELSGAIAELDSTAPVVSKFIRQNQSQITQTTASSAQVAQLLSSERTALANAIRLAPTLLANLYYIYDPLGGSFGGALTVPDLTDPANLVCSAIGAAAGSPTPAAATKECQQTAGPLLNLLQINYLPVSANPLPRPGAVTQPSSNNGVPSLLPSGLQKLLNLGVGGA